MKPVSSTLPPAGKGILHFSAACFFNLCSSALVCILQGKETGRVGTLGRAFLWRRGGLGCWAGGRRGRALQGSQSLAEPRVLGRLDLIHQDSSLVLELLQSNKRSREESAGGAWRRKELWVKPGQVMISPPKSIKHTALCQVAVYFSKCIPDHPVS